MYPDYHVRTQPTCRNDDQHRQLPLRRKNECSCIGADQSQQESQTLFCSRNGPEILNADGRMDECNMQQIIIIIGWNLCDNVFSSALCYRHRDQCALFVALCCATYEETPMLESAYICMHRINWIRVGLS